MNTNFSFIKPGELNNWTRISLSFHDMRSSLRDTTFEAVMLADAASEFFCGYFPGILYFPVDYDLLPWHDEYHVTHDGTSSRRGSITREVARVAAQLDSVNPSASLAEEPVTYYSPALCASNRTILQGLAVETMLLADGCVKRLVQSNLLAAVPWLIGAYHRLMDCTGQAQRIIELTKRSGDPGPEQGSSLVRRGLRRLAHRGRSRPICGKGSAVRRALPCDAGSGRVSNARRRDRGR
jgi:hypothetical protein